MGINWGHHWGVSYTISARILSYWQRNFSLEYLVCETMNHSGLFAYRTFIAVLSVAIIIIIIILSNHMVSAVAFFNKIMCTLLDNLFVFVLCSSLFIVDMSTLKTILSMQFMWSHKTLKYTSKLNLLRWYKFETNIISRQSV